MNRKKALVTKTPKDYKLLWMAMPFIVIVFLFSYVPIFGWIYSFFDYVPGVSIFNCDFVGLDYFKLIFRDDNILRSLKNTFIFAIINICLTPYLCLWLFCLRTQEWSDQEIYTDLYNPPKFHQLGYYLFSCYSIICL